MKKYVIGEKSYTLEPLSFYELFELPELFQAIVDAVPSVEDIRAGKIDSSVILRAMGKKAKDMLAGKLGMSEEEFKNIPMSMGMRITADFLEMNFDENFTKELARAMASGKRIFSAVSSSFSTGATVKEISAATR